MTPELKIWLETAYKNLVPEARRLVKEQILDHYSNAVEQYTTEGKLLFEAEAKALIDLGDASKAALKFEQSYLTNEELVQFRKPRNIAKNGLLIWSMAILAIVFIGFNLFMYTLEPSIDFSRGIYILLMCVYFFIQAIAARSFSLQHFILVSGVMGIFNIITMASYVYSMLQELPATKPLTHSYLIVVVFSVLCIVWQTPKAISSWRKLAVLKGTL